MALSNTVKVSKRFQIAVPAKVREQLNIQSGDRLIVDVQDGLLILLPQPGKFADHLVGLHKEVWQGIDGQGYVDQERDAWGISPSA